jgi:excinuclease ABC subunit C
MANNEIIQKVRDKFPQNPGVYFFRDSKGKIMYIGKATNLKSRVQSYFRAAETRGQIESMMPSVSNVDFQKTDSVLEALILESNLIKKYQPKYNMIGKDDKSFAYFIITKEEFPRVLIFRQTDIDFKKLQTKNYKLKTILGPYTSKRQMEIGLKIIRRIFPFHSLSQKTEKGCLDFQLGLCPGPYVGAISKVDYKKNIHGIKMILKGKKKSLITTLEKEMNLAAKKNEFEKAAQFRNKIFTLQHIRDTALITRDMDDDTLKTKNQKLKTIRIEAYDISNISGTNAAGSMIVFADSQADKSQYRKFKIKTVEGSDDVGMMREVLLRRFKNDWPMPDLVLLDGGRGHLNMAEKLLHQELGLAVAIVAVAKGKTRKNLNFQFPRFDKSKTRRAISNKFSINQFPEEIKEVLNDKNLIKQIMDEAHRFAVTFHRKLRTKNTIQ